MTSVQLSKLADELAILANKGGTRTSKVKRPYDYVAQPLKKVESHYSNFVMGGRDNTFDESAAMRMYVMEAQERIRGVRNVGLDVKTLPHYPTFTQNGAFRGGELMLENKKRQEQDLLNLETREKSLLNIPTNRELNKNDIAGEVLGLPPPLMTDFMAQKTAIL